MNPNSELLSPEEVAIWLGVSASTLANWRSLGRGPQYKKLSGSVRYRRDDVHAWIDDAGITAEQRGA
jgi:predicted DNA-binding transcriptional regulator AlpA